MGPLAGNTVTGRDGSGARAGTRTLNLVAAPLNAPIMRALQEEPKRQADLRDEIGHAAQTTLRTQLKKLCDAGAIKKRRRNRFPGVLEYGLTKAGVDLLSVAGSLEAWLRKSPVGPLELSSRPARAAVKALANGWEATIAHALADTALTLTELNNAIAQLSYPSVERRLAAMRLAGLVEARNTDGPGTPYGLTEWAREGLGLIAAAARWERRDPCLAPSRTRSI
jgi:DNA-binding HxlR family transcriptional regulator